MNRPISLPEMLDARERRAAVRRIFFKDFPDDGVLLQFTVNMPGSLKNNLMIREIFLEGFRSVAGEFTANRILSATSPDRITGPEGFLHIAGEAEDIKRKTCKLEDEHPWGRLWDFDVFTGTDDLLSRSEVDLKERLCLLCSRPAHDCARSKRHELQDLLERIDQIYKKYSVKKSESGL
jgi:holo-ACP synthase